jgi:aminoglycoside phosphotransferase (APT) family kinase protein
MEDSLLMPEYEYFRDIPGSESWIKLTEIMNGDSSDRKFRVKNNEHQRFLLHIADCRLYDRKKNEYDFLRLIHQSGAPVPEPVGFGLCSRGQALFLQTRWIYGRPGTQELQGLQKYKQYSLGVDAGLCLKQIHQCRIPPRADCWETRQMARIAKIQNKLRFCRLKQNMIRKTIDLIDAERNLLAKRPQRLLHGGFHTDNFILSYENSLSMIDLENWQYGDPLADLANVLTQIRHVSLPCAIGVLDCYFTFQVSDLELRLLRLYGALDLIEKLMQGNRLDQPVNERDLLQLQVFLKDYQSLRVICPVWYRRIRISGKLLAIR